MTNEHPEKRALVLCSSCALPILPETMGLVKGDRLSDGGTRVGRLREQFAVPLRDNPQD